MAYITAINSNPNYDQKDVNKSEIFQDMEEKFETAIDELYSDKKIEKKLEDDPFFAAGKRGLQWVDNVNKPTK